MESIPDSSSVCALTCIISTEALTKSECRKPQYIPQLRLTHV